MIEIQDLPLKDAKVLKLKRHYDNRGWFTEMFRQSWLDEAGIKNNFIFDYVSYNSHTATLRGMHSQNSSAPQAKLVTVLNGSIQDVLVDARIDSPTYGQTCSIVISKDEPSIVYVPRGFYHGFITLDPEAYVAYRVDAYHTSSAECGIMWNDPQLKVHWTMNDTMTISQRDTSHPNWNDCYKFQGTL
jgi:dTDP-4-dehydrorhamnose 3,5-epimerase